MPSSDDLPIDGIPLDERIAQLQRKRDMWNAWARKNKQAVSRHQEGVRFRLRKEVLDAYGGECACCGEVRVEFLAIDHIANDGAKDRRHKGIKSGSNFYCMLKREKFPIGPFQVLCHNCNGAKEYSGYCPHQVNG